MPIADALTQHGFGEPMSLFEGISVWPSIMIRFAGSGLSLWLIFDTTPRRVWGSLTPARCFKDNQKPAFAVDRLPAGSHV
jgi:hypothetical protein